MTPKEKAAELFNKMKGFRVKHTHSKKCAMVAINEIIEYMPNTNHRPPNYQTINEYCSEYWEQVKKEMEIL